MISQLIEARPDDLRAPSRKPRGISKYKERRRETENRMKRTQENMERLDDLREELDKQLERLKRQAEAAKRYQTLKQDEYRLKGELAVLRRRGLRAQQREQQSRVARSWKPVSSARISVSVSARASWKSSAISTTSWPVSWKRTRPPSMRPEPRSPVSSRVSSTPEPVSSSWRRISRSRGVN